MSKILWFCLLYKPFPPALTVFATTPAGWALILPMDLKGMLGCRAGGGLAFLLTELPQVKTSQSLLARKEQPHETGSKSASAFKEYWVECRLLRYSET